jgi:AbrB family looped-hinge helix DNA binding protein
MPSNRPISEVQLGSQGRVVIPAALRKALHLKPGDRLIARLQGGALVLEREAVGKRLQDRFRHIPAHVSLVDELIAQRRADGLNLGCRDQADSLTTGG